MTIVGHTVGAATIGPLLQTMKLDQEVRFIKDKIQKAASF